MKTAFKSPFNPPFSKGEIHTSKTNEKHLGSEAIPFVVFPPLCKRGVRGDFRVRDIEQEETNSHKFGGSSS
jgi:hypothetical protein